MLATFPRSYVQKFPVVTLWLTLGPGLDEVRAGRVELLADGARVCTVAPMLTYEPPTNQQLLPRCP